MIWLNEIAAVPALLLWLLVFRGFWPHVRLRGTGPLHFMVQGVSLMSVMLIGRLFYWDILRPFLRWHEYIPSIEQSVSNGLTNGGINTLTTIAGYLILRGLHHTIPESERRFYTPFTAAFYPSGITFFRKDKE